MSRFLGAIFAAAAAYWIARAVGVPVWRDWPMGDATDIAITTFYAAILLTRRPA